MVTIQEGKQIKSLFKKRKQLLKQKKELARFEEPVLILIRRDKRVEFYEGITKGEFRYSKGEDSEGNDLYGTLYLDPQFILTFTYGKEVFRGYIADEQSPFPYPQKPLAYAEIMENVLTKIMYDIKQYNLRVQKVKWDTIRKLAWIGAFCVVAFLIYRYWMATRAPTETVELVTNATNMTTTLVDNILTPVQTG